MNRTAVATTPATPNMTAAVGTNPRISHEKPITGVLELLCCWRKGEPSNAQHTPRGSRSRRTRPATTSAAATGWRRASFVNRQLRARRGPRTPDDKDSELPLLPVLSAHKNNEETI